MRLKRYRVTNYRSVIDSGWIDTERVTALVGINESGKSNLLLPLWKLNPARDGELKPTSDYPKANFASIRKDPEQYAFVAADFDCEGDTQKLASMTSLSADEISTVRVERFFDARYEVSFPNYQRLTSVDAKEVVKLLESAKTDIVAMSELAKEASVKAEFVSVIDTATTTLATQTAASSEELDDILQQLGKVVPEAPAAKSTIVPRFGQLIDAISSQLDTLKAPAPQEMPGVKEYILNKLPKFVYYSNYGNLDSEIYLPHVVDNLKRPDLGAREAAKARTLRVLFDFVTLEPKEILELGRDFRDANGKQPTEDQIGQIATKKRERTILLNSAGTDLTKKFRDWWKQGDYNLEFQADGDHFRIWVSDSKRPEKVELEDRSTGLQWFLSFYLIFLVESDREHSNAILLLDEPGLSLHPIAQRDLSAFFDNLSKTNQLIYTTHSPFLVDADSLDRARKVYVGEDGSTKASSDLRRGNGDARKNGATYAVHSALNMNVAESLLIGCHPVVVEGPSDQHYLATIKTLLIGSNKISPKRELVFPPSHGANNAKVVASILSGRDEVLPIMLFDGDDAGNRMAMDMKNALYSTSKDRVLSTTSFVGFEKSEVEDLFPADFIADVVDRLHRISDVPFADVVKSGQPVIPQIKDWAASQGITLEEGWKVDIALEAKKRALAKGIGAFDAQTIERWVKLFSAFEIGM